MGDPQIRVEPSQPMNAPTAVAINHTIPTMSTARPMNSACSPRVDASGSSACLRKSARFFEFERNARSKMSPMSGIAPIPEIDGEVDQHAPEHDARDAEP